MDAQTAYLTVARVAELHSVSELTVRRKIATGEIPAVKLATAGRGAVRIPEHELRRWLEGLHMVHNGGAAA